jgi:hypothetical protein
MSSKRRPLPTPTDFGDRGSGKPNRNFQHCVIGEHHFNPFNELSDNTRKQH